jgi:hypothetical protein
MAKVYGLHMIGLRPGVNGEDFEKFFREKVVPLPKYTGWKGYLLKGDRGDREGKYLLMIEIESVEARDRYAPGEGESDEARRYHEVYREANPEAKSVFDEWDKLASGWGAPTIYTDYVVVA